MADQADSPSLWNRSKKAFGGRSFTFLQHQPKASEGEPDLPGWKSEKVLAGRYWPRLSPFQILCMTLPLPVCPIPGPISHFSFRRFQYRFPNPSRLTPSPSQHEDQAIILCVMFSSLHATVRPTNIMHPYRQQTMIRTNNASASYRPTIGEV